MKIFLGYPSERLAAAEEIYAFLVSEGHEVWFDKRSLVGGDQWDDVRRSAQDQADLLIHLCSPEITERSGVVLREIRYTLKLADDQPFGRLYALFIRLDEFRLPIDLLRFHYLDYFRSDWREKLKASLEKASGVSPVSSSEGPTITVEEQVKGDCGMEKVQFSERTDTFECEGNYLRYHETGLYWEFVNAKLASVALEDFYNIRVDFLTNESEVSEFNKSTLELSSDEFFRKDEFVSARVHTYYYWSGAAHPNHYLRSFNFGGSHLGLITMPDLLYHDAKSARKILDYCEKIIDAEIAIENEDGENDLSPFFGHHKGDDETVWKLIGQFNFDPKGITVNFSPYDVLPYAFGSREALVPWRFVEGMLNERFRDLPEKLQSIAI